MLKKDIRFLKLSSAAAVSSLCLKRSVLAPPLNTQSALIGPLTRARASIINSKRAALLIQFLHSRQGVSCGREEILFLQTFGFSNFQHVLHART